MRQALLRAALSLLALAGSAHAFFGAAAVRRGALAKPLPAAPQRVVAGRRGVVTAAYSFANGDEQLTKAVLCKGTCLGKAGFNTVVSFFGLDASAQQVSEYVAANPQTTQSLAIALSLFVCLTIVNSLDGEDEKETFENREAFVAWLTRPPDDYSSDEGFNLFLVVFHGYCLYDASRRGDFEGFSFFSFLPVLAVIVMLQVAAKLRANARGWVAPPRSEAGWKQYREAPKYSRGEELRR